MSTPQDPRNPGEPPRDSGEQAAGGRNPESPDEPFVTPAAPQPPDDTQAPRNSPQPPDESAAAAGAPQPPSYSQSGDRPRTSEEPGPAGADPAAGAGAARSSEDPPTEYLPKILHRESSGAGGSHTGADTGPEESPEPGVRSPADEHPTQMLPKQPEQPGGPGSDTPRLDKGTAAYTHGWQPGSAEPPPGQPMGEVPPQAWSARPEEQEPGQAWQPQSPGQPGSPSGGLPYPPPGAYGSGPGQSGDQSGWGAPPTGEYPGRSGEHSEQQGWGSEQTGQQGWSDRPGQQSWGGQQARGYEQHPGQPGWGGEQSGERAWGGEQPGQQGWSGTQPGQQGWGGEQPGWGGEQPGWGGEQPGQQGWGSKQSDRQGWGGGQQPGGYPAYPQQQYQPYGATQEPERSGPQVLSIIGFVCAAVSLLFCPLLFGIAGIALGVIGHIRGESLGKWAAIAAGVCLIIGIVLALALSGIDMVPIESAP